MGPHFNKNIQVSKLSDLLGGCHGFTVYIQFESHPCQLNPSLVAAQGPWALGCNARLGHG